MLSTLAFRNGGVRALKTFKAVIVTPVRGCAAARVPMPKDRALEPDEDLLPQSFHEPVPLETKLANWDSANAIFFGPERDLKNYPHLKQAVEPETYQFGILPTRWFMALYPKLGVTGGYTLLWGSFLLALNKEIIVGEHIFGEALFVALVITIGSIKFGPKIGAFLDKRVEAVRKELYEDPLENAKSTYNNEIAVCNTDVWRLDAIPNVFQAKQELVDLQLETQYRQRLAEVHKTIKQRLDYQADLETTQRSFEQAHMVNWIVDHVKKSITPQQEKDSISSCIGSLKKLSATASI